MTEICPIDKCVGCWACLSSCTHQAIRVEEDVLGFRYPSIDPSKCVDCGLCRNSCPANIPQEKRFPKECYAVQVENRDELGTCASGGAATAISRYILRLGGVVYGCSGADIRQVKHIRVEHEEDLSLLKGSKYVQSDTSYIFKSVRDDLRAGRTVFFVGTPCQVAGLRAFLRKGYVNLLTADLVCHGVPSQRLLNENLDYYHSKGIAFEENQIHFREKRPGKKGNQTQSAKIEYGWFFEKNQPYSAFPRGKAYFRDPYMFAFLCGLIFRKSCYTCPYAYASRVGDFTLSDFWGLGTDAEMPVGEGVSSVLLNTEKAQELFRSVRAEVRSVPRTVQESVMGNGQLQHPSVRHPRYELFRELYPRYGLARSVKVCLRNDRLKLYIKKILGRQ